MKLQALVTMQNTLGIIIIIIVIVWQEEKLVLEENMYHIPYLCIWNVNVH